MTGLQTLSDENVLRLYDSIRDQVSADVRLGSPQRLLGETARLRAERLQDELYRRRVKYAPIVWGV
jgi:hypothetical protein